jgi:D-glycero-D-manno-heptose 1,7-bisphosphate phosphatase
MKLALLDRDGVVIVNRANNIKAPADIVSIEGAPEAVRRLNEAGFTVAICTNQPEVGRGAMAFGQLASVHVGLQRLLKEQGAVIDRIFTSTSSRKSPRRKPAGGMLAEAMAHYGARPSATPFVGDQLDDLKAAFHAGCRRILVRTGLGTKAMAASIPDYVRHFTVYDNLLAASLGFIHGIL